MIRTCTTLALLALSCAAPADTVAEQDGAAPDAWRVNLPTALIDPGGLAAGLLSRAGYDAPAATVDDPDAAVQALIWPGTLENCNEGPDRSAWACTERAMWPGDRTYIWISDEVPAALQVSVLLHELGHVVGLEHSHGGFMNPDRDIGTAPLCADSACL